jgi:hypothetical protein
MTRERTLFDAEAVEFPVTDRGYWRPFDRFLQRQAPRGWRIRAIYSTTYKPGQEPIARPIRYLITTDDGHAATVSRSGISEGWQLKLHDTGISTEFTVTTPDGRELWFHDCWNA